MKLFLSAQDSWESKSHSCANFKTSVVTRTSWLSFSKSQTPVTWVKEASPLQVIAATSICHDHTGTHLNRPDIPSRSFQWFWPRFRETSCGDCRHCRLFQQIGEIRKNQCPEDWIKFPFGFTASESCPLSPPYMGIRTDFSKTNRNRGQSGPGRKEHCMCIQEVSHTTLDESWSCLVSENWPHHSLRWYGWRLIEMQQ